jgi:hypothetical protein
MARLITTYEGISYTHRLLWEIAEQQAEIVRNREREWVHFSLVAVTFAFHALEAYVNFAGEHLAPDFWADEQNNFRREPYRGWKGKLRKMFELTGVPWEPEVRPLKTIFEFAGVARRYRSRKGRAILRGGRARRRRRRRVGPTAESEDPRDGAPEGRAG